MISQHTKMWALLDNLREQTGRLDHLYQVEELLKDYEKPEDIIGEGGLLKQLTKAIL